MYSIIRIYLYCEEVFAVFNNNKNIYFINPGGEGGFNVLIYRR